MNSDDKFFSLLIISICLTLTIIVMSSIACEYFSFKTAVDAGLHQEFNAQTNQVIWVKK